MYLIVCTNLPDAKNRKGTANRSITLIAFLDLVSCFDMRGPILQAIFSKWAGFILKKFENCNGSQVLFYLVYNYYTGRYFAFRCFHRDKIKRSVCRMKRINMNYV